MTDTEYSTFKFGSNEELTKVLIHMIWLKYLQYVIPTGIAGNFD